MQNITDFINEANKTTNIICSIRLWNMDTDELKACNSLNGNIPFRLFFFLAYKIAKRKYNCKNNNRKQYD